MLSGVNPRLTPHDLRRTVAKRVYDITCDLRIVQQLLGHRHITSTLHYIGAVDRSALRDALNQVQPIIDALPLGSERPQ